MLGFPRAILDMPRPWVAWVMLLFGINFVPGLLYWSSPEGKVVLAALMLGGLLQTAIFSARGFARLLGIGHLAWLPMVLWLWMRLGTAPVGSLFRYWLLAVIILNSLFSYHRHCRCDPLYPGGTGASPAPRPPPLELRTRNPSYLRYCDSNSSKLPSNRINLPATVTEAPGARSP